MNPYDLSPGRKGSKPDEGRAEIFSSRTEDAPPAAVEDSPLSSMIVDTTVEDPHASTHDDMLARKVGAILDTLPAREALIMRLRFGVNGREGRTLEEIGRMLGITRERTRQLESRAYARLRETVDPDLLQGLEK